MTLYFFIGTTILLVAGFGAIGWILYHRMSFSTKGQGEDQSFLMLQNQLNEMRRTLDARLQESVEAMKKQAEEMIRVGETNKRVSSVADQLKHFENILKNPKQRGILGEYFLETVLKNVLPPNAYEIQYKFADGEIVDAVIVTKEGIIPIDSKFSLENYNRITEEQDSVRRGELEKLFRQDLKKRIDETAKYIRPREGTLDFAFMFIPHEAIYYDLLVSQVGAIKVNTRDLIDYALKEKRVIIVSPTTFYAYLQTILQGLRALKIEESAKEIQKQVGELVRHVVSYDDYMKKVGIHMGTTVGMYNNAYKELGKINKDIARISGETTERLEPLVLEKPEKDEE